MNKDTSEDYKKELEVLLNVDEDCKKELEVLLNVNMVPYVSPLDKFRGRAKNAFLKLNVLDAFVVVSLTLLFLSMGFFVVPSGVLLGFRFILGGIILWWLVN